MIRIPRKVDQEFRKLSKGYLFENGLGLNETAMFIYNHCDGNNTEKNILDALINKYQPENTSHLAMLQDDLDECLKILVEKKMVAYGERSI